MKKLALILAIAMIAAFAAPAMASDFTTGGQARFEAINYDKDWVDGDDDSYFDMRYRLALNWKVNDNVSTQLRFDIAEGTWGDGYRPAAGNDTIMVDRAWAKIKQGPLTLQVGQQAGDWGHSLIWSDQFQGIQATLNFSPFVVNLLYAKDGEGKTNNDDDDYDTYGIMLRYLSDAFTGGLIYAKQDEQAAEFEPFMHPEVTAEVDLNAFGGFFTADVSGITLKGAIAFFDGEVEAGGPHGDIDITGTQAFLSADMAFTDAFSAGLTLIWADDVDRDEIQGTEITDDGVFDPLDFGGKLTMNNAFGKFWGAETLRVFNVQNHVVNQIADVNLEGVNGQGVMGAIGRVQFAATDAITFYGRLGWVEPNGDDTILDNVMYAFGSVDWVWVPAVTVSAGVAYMDADFDYVGSTDALLTTMQLTVAF